MDQPLNSIEFVSIEPTLPLPIAFNTFKHHLGFTKEFLNNELKPGQNLKMYKGLFFTIGGSLIDYYIGSLSPNEIANQIINYLTSIEIIDIDGFIEWVDSDGKNYKCVYLTDGSKWALRVGRYKERYIHIHPGRYSVETIRVKSTTLKTALAFNILKVLLNKEFNIDNINFARQNLALLSPMNYKSSLNPVSRLLALFNT